ncbi:glycoside hydrolase family 113 [Streptacidiphilus sp. PAMC 29251]
MTSSPAAIATLRPTATPTPTPSPTPTSAKGYPGVARVAHPWVPGQTQLGVDVFWEANPSESDRTTRSKIDATVNDVVRLNANWISISFPFVTGGVSSNSLSAAHSMTPSTARLSLLIATAKAAGLRVTLRPTLNEAALTAEDAKAWRGSITPSDRGAWFASYRRFLTPYARLAEQQHVDAFNVSTELTSMEKYTADWKTLTGGLASIYSGDLVDSVNFDRIAAETVRIPNARLGIDAYFPMKHADDTATVADLVKGWNAALDPYSAGKLSTLTFSEVGIVPQDGAYSAPYVWKASGSLDPQIQVNWDTAACQVAKARHVAGIFWWYLDLENSTLASSAKVTAADPMDILNTPALKVIRNCFANFSAPAGGH